MTAKRWFSMRAANRDDQRVGFVSIYGDIGGYGLTANDFRAALESLGELDTIRLNITSDGGDISAGYAIHNLLASHPAHKIFTTVSLAASMGSVIFMAGDERIMPKNAFLMIHNPWGAMVGSGDEFLSFGQALLDMQESIVESYVDATGQKPKAIREMMDRETWLKASTAKKLGFATKVVEPRDMNAKLGVSFDRVKTFNRTPAEIRALATKESAMTKRNQKNARDDDNEFEGEGEGHVTAKTEAEIRAEVLAAHKETRSLCKLAGFADMADKLIEDNADRAAVMAALEKAADDKAAKDKADKAKGKGKGKAAEGGDDELSTRRGNDSRSEPELDQNAIYAKFNKRK
jgi:ATP-dependent Clp protease protease subunit